MRTYRIAISVPDSTLALLPIRRHSSAIRNSSKNNDAASKEPKLLSRYGKDKVCLWLRDKITVFDGAYIIVIQSLSVKLSGTDRLDSSSAAVLPHPDTRPDAAMHRHASADNCRRPAAQAGSARSQK